MAMETELGGQRRPPPSARRLRAPMLVAGGLAAWSAYRRPDIALALPMLGALFTLVEWWRPLCRRRPAIRRAGAATDATGFIVDEVVAGLGLAALLEAA